MYQCDQHPYKQCTFYDQAAQQLQCAQCILPPELTESNENLIDIERMTYLASSLLESQIQIEGVWLKVESFLQESQEKTHQAVESVYLDLREQLLIAFDQFKHEVEQGKLEIRKHNQTGKQLKLLLDNLDHQPALPQYIQTIRELSDALQDIAKVDPALTFSTRINDVQSKFLTQVEQQLSTVNNMIVVPRLEIRFDPPEENFRSTQEAIRPQAQSKRSTQTNISKKVHRETLTQIVKKELRCSLLTEFLLTSITACFNLVVVGTQEGMLIVYDNEQWEELQRLSPHQQPIKVLCRQPGEQTYLVSGSNDASIKVYKREFNEDLAQFYLSDHVTLRGHHGAILDILMVDVQKQKCTNMQPIMPISRLISASADNTVRIWDYISGEALMNYSGHQMDVHSVAYSSSLNRICSGAKDKTIRVWDGLDFRFCRPLLKLTGHTDAVMGVTVLNENQQQILSCSLDKTIKVWEIKQGTLVRSFPANAFLTRSYYYQLGLVAVLGFENRIDVYDYNISTRVHQLKTTAKVNAITIDNGKVYSIENKHINQYY